MVAIHVMLIKKEEPTGEAADSPHFSDMRSSSPCARRSTQNKYYYRKMMVCYPSSKANAKPRQITSMM